MTFPTIPGIGNPTDIAATYVSDAAHTDALTAPLHALGLLDDVKSAREIQLVAGGALTCVQAIRVQRMNDNYAVLCWIAGRLGIEEEDARCVWAEQRIRQAGGWMEGWTLTAL